MKLSVDLDEHIESPPDKIWKALTDSTMLARWLMPNDFEPRVGKRFTFFPECPTSWKGNRRSHQRGAECALGRSVVSPRATRARAS